MMRKADAQSICGTLTSTSKMPCKSSDLPTEACHTGYRMAQIKGSICSKCYANNGFYVAYQNTIKPAQFARLDAVYQALESAENAQLWVSGMVSLIGTDPFFRWHSSGDLQNVHHLNLIVLVARATPDTMHWLPTREYSMVKQYIDAFGADAIPKNLIIRLSAMYPDQPVKIPSSLQGIDNVTASNVHTSANAIHGVRCGAPDNGGACGDCRACWSNAVVSYELH